MTFRVIGEMISFCVSDHGMKALLIFNSVFLTLLFMRYYSTYLIYLVIFKK